ncbi:Kiwa anti-phage protein KwaB-like domain-containing protein [Thermococcus sp.]|uniref:Kiwa anti-phage protein KwaB-like domain-containing protein n=1 Tax=Thermococcus sp. TaxID=35749 RepID=UPI002611791A|nr:Kiwa anti-phage protein KwaB-like domain-containing protein [Thermococcus sp.]
MTKGGRQKLYNFFAYLGGEGSAIKRIVMERNLQETLTEALKRKMDAFIPVDPDKIIDFTENPGYKPDPDEVFVIEKFNVPHHIKNSIENPRRFHKLTESDYDKIKAIYWGEYTKDDKSGEKSYRIAFQIFDSRRIIGRHLGKYAIFYGHETNTFEQVDHKLLVINERLDALYENGKLYFKSFYNAKRIFGDQISEYYREATDAEVKKFGNDLFGNPNIPEDFLDSQARKFIFWIIKNNSSFEYQKIVEKGKDFGLTLTTDDNTGKLVLPKAKREFKQLLRLLNSDMYKSPITEEKFVTNSKRKLQ